MMNADFLLRTNVHRVRRSNTNLLIPFLFSFIVLFLASCSKTETPTQTNQIDLLAKYPTMLTRADHDPRNARKWLFTPQDIYHISNFQYQYNDELTIQTEDASLGIGHTKDGAVWAAIVPDQSGKVISKQNSNPETVKHIWARLHPNQINSLFAPNTVKPHLDQNDATDTYLLIKRIAEFKFKNSYHAGQLATVPAPGCFVFDIDTDKVRRFFHIDESKQELTYSNKLEDWTLPKPIQLDAVSARDIFDKVWTEFDTTYAMFAIKPDVDWQAVRREYSLSVEKVKTKEELIGLLAEMLGRLEDEHVWIRYDNNHKSTFKRSARTNANPKAYSSYFDQFEAVNRSLSWGKTEDGIGFIAIHTWSDQSVPAKVDQLLEQLKDTKAIIIDVRLNGGGSEPLAQLVAGRFVDHERIYAFSQYRNGPKHENLTRKYERKFAPTGEWQYMKPVITLIGQRCMSSNEAFVKMMGECPNVTLMGEATRGSSGNPKILELPMDITVSVPQWIDYRADGKPLEGNGVDADVEFIFDEKEYGSDQDSLLAAALERLRN